MSTLSPQERAYYESTLKQAIRLYYARAYRAALPLFAEVALRIDTLEVLYWLGMSAYHAGRPDIAVIRFRQILGKYPKFHQAHLYLAMAYAARGEFEKAERELALAKRTLPKEWGGVIAQVERQWSRARFANYMHFKTGFHYDSNPGARPDVNLFPTPFGAVIQVRAKPEGWFSRVDLSDELYYDVFDRGGLVWRARLDFLANLYMGDDQGVDLGKNFDYYRWQVASGPSWQERGWRVGSLVKVGQRFFGQTHLSNFTGITPTFSYRMLPGLETYGGYSFQFEWFDGNFRLFNVNRAVQDYTQHIGFIGWHYQGDQHRFILSGDGGRRSARADIYSYWEGGVNLEWFAVWPFDFQSHIGIAYHRRDYEAPFRLVANRKREEDRFYSNFTIIKHLGHGFFVEARWDFYLNQANIELYDYQRHVVGINIGIDFNF